MTTDPRDTDAQADDIIRRASEIGVLVITPQNVALMRALLARTS